MKSIENIKIKKIQALEKPSSLHKQLAVTPEISDFIHASRKNIANIINGHDKRLLVIVGPCSIHDPEAALDYAKKLKPLIDQYSKQLYIVMRVYFEKPRTTIGWKGLINDPHLDGSRDINHGLFKARELLLELNKHEIPTATEFLDTTIPQYIADLVSWGAIGARTTESQIHRELASGLSMPIGFKNATNGNVQIAIDAIRASQHAHSFLSVTDTGEAAIVHTTGNPDCHIILRGGSDTGPNFDIESINATANTLKQFELTPKIMVDCSHANSKKDPKQQAIIIDYLCQQILNGDTNIMGMMIESNLKHGNQVLKNKEDLIYGRSITDACIGWEETERVLEILNNTMIERQKTLLQVRKKIDSIDRQLQMLINQRAELALSAVDIKKEKGDTKTKVHYPEREKEILELVTKYKAGPLSHDAVKNIFTAIIEECREIQEDSLNNKDQ